MHTTHGKVGVAVMRGSQRARDILKAMGEEAFYWFPVSRAWGPRAHMRVQRPLGGRHIAQLKKEYLLEGRCCPRCFMALVPGTQT